MFGGFGVFGAAFDRRDAVLLLLLLLMLLIRTSAASLLLPELGSSVLEPHLHNFNSS